MRAIYACSSKRASNRHLATAPKVKDLRVSHTDIVEAIKRISWLRYEEGYDEHYDGFVVIPKSLRKLLD